MKKHIKLALSLLLCTTLTNSSCTAAVDPNNSNLKSYTSVSDNFNNPDRGFYTNSNTNNQDNPLTVSYLQGVRAKNITMVRRVYVISAYKNSALPDSFLTFVKKDMEAARTAGVRLIVRFAYNWEWGGYDASSSRISSHLDQLKGVFTDNSDAVSFVEAGFMGYWGEWHHSTSNLENATDRKNILYKLLSVIPSDRMVALRYVRDKKQIFGNTPLTGEQAFKGSYQARTGAHNDCFVASNSDMNTYDWNNPTVREQERTYLNSDNRYVVQGGETCAESEFDDCPNSLKELERMRWSTINADFEANVLKGWKDQGCMGEVQRRLGYRFRLISSATPKNVKPGGSFDMSFKVTNEGWASPYNSHLLEVVLRNSQTGKEYYLRASEDVRLWLPGETREVNISAGLDKNMPAGQYQIFLNLPDPSSRLYTRPEYSIRFASKDVWEPTKGYNSLQQSVTVGSGGSSYTGSQFFKAR